MEFTKEYTGKRFEIVYGTCDGPEGKALELVNAALRQEVPYLPLVVKAPTGKNHVLYVGTPESNPYVAKRLHGKALASDETVLISEKQGETETVYIAGGSPVSVLYAAVTFADDFIPAAKRRPVGHPFFHAPFTDAELPKTEVFSRPAIRDRGLWTWGHVLYDYENYFRNMARLRLNKLTVWNDFPPVNAKQFVDCAHSYGIKVVWGFTWGWDQYNSTDKLELSEWKKKVCEDYGTLYAPLGGDGIYFQTSFTETSEQSLDGVSRAKLAVDWVNPIADALLSAYPDVKIEFGLHAGSVKNDLTEIAKTDPRVAITWEDCGAFPYAYGAQNLNEKDETLRFTDEIASLRDGNGFGVVFKGMTWLDWAHFEHHYGSFVIGKSDDAEIEEKTALRRDTIRYQQGYWMQNGDYARQIFEHIADRTNGKADLEALLEDGMFDRHIWLPTALYAEMLWNPKQDFDTLCGKVMRRPSTECI